MMRGVLLTHARAPIADIGAGSTQHLGRRRKPAHPADGQGAEIGAIPAKTNAELSKLSVVTALHSDHIIGAAIADLSAGRTGIDTMLQVWMWGVIMMVHNAPFGENKSADDAKDRPAQLRVAKNSKRMRAVSLYSNEAADMSPQIVLTQTSLSLCATMQGTLSAARVLFRSSSAAR